VSTRRLSLGLSAVALCVSALRVAGLAQSLPSPSAQPTFRSTVDLLTVDTSVRDKKGLPIEDLKASDFTVTIDGRPRKVVSAVFFKTDPADRRRVAGGASPTPRHVSNEGTQPGRVVVFALDAETIRAGQERPLFETASRMLDGLSPADAVGLVELPGPAIEVTRDHAVVAEALKRFRGRARNEAEEVVLEGRLRPPPGAIEMPARELNARANTQRVLLDLARLLRGMTAVRAPRSVILISGGLAFDNELMTQYRELQRAAAESRVVLYTVLLEQVGHEVSRGETRPDAAVRPDKAEGLASIGTMTGGMFFHGVATAAGVFDRIESEVSTFYQLGLESGPADADGKEHDVKVTVNRPGLDVRAPSHVAVARPAKGAQRAARDPLAAALEQPTDLPDVPIAVTTYSTRPGGDRVRLLISAEIGAPNGAAPAEWGFAVNQHGKNVVTRRGRFAAGLRGPRIVSTTVEVPAGEYRLRVASVDAEDRLGVLEHAVTAGYEIAAAAAVGDLIVGVAEGGQLEPRRRLERSEELTALLELLPTAAGVPGGMLQLIPGGSARSVLSTPLTVRPAGAAGEPAVLEAHAKLASVPAGRYTASAALMIDGQPLTRISRLIEIVGAPPAAPAPDVAPPVVTPAPPPENAAGASADDIMRRVGGYVAQYGGQASLLVGVERYLQSVNRRAIVASGRRMGISDGVAGERRLVSEFALVANPSASGGWLGYRDVIEVDGKPVADRRDRLERLFRSEAPDLQEARRIVEEAARYNIGPISRNFNLPTTTLFFFHAGNLPRFTFRRKGRERIGSVETVEIDFREERGQTLIMNGAGEDVPASGTLWVDPVDGAVVRTRLELRKFDDAGSQAAIEVDYRKDPVLAMWVPSRMMERYSGGSIDTAATIAVYQDFKRFQTSVKIK